MIPVELSGSKGKAINSMRVNGVNRPVNWGVLGIRMGAWAESRKLRNLLSSSSIMQYSELGGRISHGVQ